MRILSILASPAPGGAETLVRSLGAELVGRGHDFHVLFMSHAAGVGNPPDFEGEFLERLGRDGIGFDIMSPNAFRSTLRAVGEFRRVARTYAPDLVHSHLARGVLSRSFSGLSLPTVYTHHSVTANFPTPLFALFNWTVDQYVAVSGACRAFLEQHARGSIVTIANGVPSDFASGKPRQAIRASPLVLAVGSLRAAKDYPTLIEAAAILLRRAPASLAGVGFAIAGEGAERPALERLIEERGLAGRFKLLGARADMAALMQQADLLVNSSAYEGLPVTLVEAAASGLPIVASDVGGNSEVVVDGVNGLLVPPAQPELLAMRILELLTDPERYAACSTAALAQSKKFSMAACADAHLEVYRNVLDR
ncbi:MAG TPA: glycosyltransferase [Allosphingosinicella sp.]